MTIDKEKLKALAEAAGSDEWYAAGDLRYCDDKTGETHGLHHDDGRFIAAASPAAILALLAEIERLELDNRSLKGSCAKLGSEHAGMARSFKKANRMQSEARAERDQLKAENDALRKDAERYRWIRTADWWRSPVCAISNPKEQAKLGSDCPSGERLDAQIDAAMAKEAIHD